MGLRSAPPPDSLSPRPTPTGASSFATSSKSGSDSGATRESACQTRPEPKSDSPARMRSEEHTSELQSQSNLVCRLLLEKKKKNNTEQAAKQQQRPIHERP